MVESDDTVEPEVQAEVQAEDTEAPIAGIGTMVFGTLVGTGGSIIGRRKMLEDRHELELEEIKEFMQSKR